MKSKTEITIFTSDIFGEIRTCQVNNQIMFVGKDVATALGYRNPSNALQVHVDAEDKTTYPIQVSGSNYKTNALFVNESGLYALILSDRRAAISPRKMRKGASSPMKRLSTVPMSL